MTPNWEAIFLILQTREYVGMDYGLWMFVTLLRINYGIGFNETLQ